LAASSHSSLQYLLPCAGGQPQVSRPHLLVFPSFAMAITLLSKFIGIALEISFAANCSSGQARELLNADFRWLTGSFHLLGSRKQLDKLYCQESDGHRLLFLVLGSRLIMHGPTTGWAAAIS
jgi:hypothetical protein